MEENKNPEKKKKARLWKDMDGSGFIMALCALYGVYLVIKGIVGAINAP